MHSWNRQIQTHSGNILLQVEERVITESGKKEILKVIGQQTKVSIKKFVFMTSIQICALQSELYTKKKIS